MCLILGILTRTVTLRQKTKPRLLPLIFLMTFFLSSFIMWACRLFIYIKSQPDSQINKKANNLLCYLGPKLVLKSGHSPLNKKLIIMSIINLIIKLPPLPSALPPPFSFLSFPFLFFPLSPHSLIFLLCE